MAQLVFKDSLAASYRWAQGRILGFPIHLLGPRGRTSRDKPVPTRYREIQPRGVIEDKTGGSVYYVDVYGDCL